MSDLFESAWLKWAWAVVDSNVLVDNVNVLAKSDRERRLGMLIRSEYHAKRHCVILSVEEIVNPFPALWGLLLGDAVHNLRSSLDHLAWALYKRGKTPNLREKREKGIYFPIAYDPTDFRDQAKRKLPGVLKADLALVRACQPYARGKRNIPRHFLVTLDELSRHDKHRTLQPVYAVPDNTVYHIVDHGDCIVRRFTPAFRRKLEVGAELGRFYVKKTGPEPYIDVEPSFAIQPSVHERLSLQEFLERNLTAIRLILQWFAPIPPSARDILAKTDALEGQEDPTQLGPSSPLKGQSR